MSPISASSVTQTVLITSAVTLTYVAATILYKKWQQAKIPSNWSKVGIIKKVHLYPLKSGYRIELERAEVTLFGLKQTKEDAKGFQLRDRILVVYGAKDNEFRTARTYPKMFFIKVSVRDDDQLAIDAPGMSTLYVKIPSRKDHQVTNVKFWMEERIPAVDCGDEAGSWFSRYIIEKESGLRLGFHDGSQQRNISKTHQKLLNYYKTLSNQSTGLFSDLSSVSLINQSSVNDLNERIEDGSVVAENFRHNFIVDGTDIKPYDEDDWEWIKIGENVILRNIKECTRCVMTTINPESGVRNPKRQPLATLGKYRMSKGPEKCPVIGLNLEVRKSGTVCVGDPVYVVKKSQ